jgi:hypothetical protein
MTPAFEQFARSKGWPTWRKPDGETYIDTRVQFASEAWQAREVPAGFVVVPEEPTEAMVRATHSLDLSYMPDQWGADRAGVYRAMLAAAPQQPASLGGGHRE